VGVGWVGDCECVAVKYSEQVKCPGPSSAFSRFIRQKLWISARMAGLTHFEPLKKLSRNTDAQVIPASYIRISRGRILATL
jgi:hypothetical protein